MREEGVCGCEKGVRRGHAQRVGMHNESERTNQENKPLVLWWCVCESIFV